MVKKITTVESPAMSLNQSDGKKILKGAGIAFGGAFLFSVLTWASVSLGAGAFEWGAFWNAFKTSALPAALAVGINAVMKWWQGQSK